MHDTFGVEIDYGTCEARTSGTGQIEIVWRGNPLGRINEGILKSIGFLYKNREDAEGGAAIGATAFIISVSSEGAAAAGIVNDLPMGFCHGYVVTASHVVNEGYTVLRITQVHGKVDILELPKAVRNSYSESAGKDAWIWHNEGNDVVVYPLKIFPNRIYNGISLSSFSSTASKFGDVHHHLDVEVGDEVFMPGRLLDLDCPRPPTVVRFGKLAASPTVEVPTMSCMPPQESYLAELRTDSGFSGAPVLITKPPISPKAEAEMVTLKDKTWLLGINWGHLRHFEHIVDRNGTRKSKDWRSESNSGIANILPAWKLYQVLHYDELKARRLNEWKTFRKHLESGTP